MNIPVVVFESVSEDAVFLKRPKAEPYYVAEGQEGPVMECSFALEFRNRTRYEPSWTVVAGDLPRFAML